MVLKFSRVEAEVSFVTRKVGTKREYGIYSYLFLPGIGSYYFDTIDRQLIADRI